MIGSSTPAAQPARSCPVSSPPCRCTEPVDRFGDEPFVPGPARRLDLRLHRCLTAEPLGCLDHPGCRWWASARFRTRSLGDPLSARRRPISRARPLGAEPLGRSVDRRRSGRQQRMSALRKGDRRLENVGEGPGPPAGEQRQPAAEGPGHHHCQQPRAGMASTPRARIASTVADAARPPGHRPPGPRPRPGPTAGSADHRRDRSGAVRRLAARTPQPRRHRRRCRHAPAPPCRRRRRSSGCWRPCRGRRSARTCGHRAIRSRLR